MNLLEVSNLCVEFQNHDEPIVVVNDVSLSMRPRETVGLVGESGSGKTQIAMALLGLQPPGSKVSGSVLLGGEEILHAPAKRLRDIRGNRIAMIFQDPMTSLNPYISIGRQLRLVLAQHRDLKGEAAEREIINILDAVQLPRASRRLNAFPHEFSGGMRQRIMIAAALLCRPEILIADEATTSLDVTVQAGILALLAELRDAYAMALMLISHDLGVIAGHSDRMLVMHRGQVVEAGETQAVFANPQASYTRKLLNCALSIHDPGRPTPTGGVEPLLMVDKLRVCYDLPRQNLFGRREHFLAVKEVSLRITRGETLGLVGESGCGKSSLARAVVGLVNSSGGRVSMLRGNDARSTGMSSQVQMVFQDPLVSLNPRMTIRDIVAEPLTVHRKDLSRAARFALVDTMLKQVGLTAAIGGRYPHSLSGGQCQRVGIARALVTEPALLVCDEALSALDASVQAEIADLLLRLQERLGLSMLFIAHDLAVVKRMCHRIAVMYLGRIVELGSAGEIYSGPLHPYTRALLNAARQTDTQVRKTPRDPIMTTEIPAPWAPPSGCSYRTRCPYAIDACRKEIPECDISQATQVACLRVGHLPAWSGASGEVGQS